jgi:hypothetical protein
MGEVRPRELEKAFDAALAHVERLIRGSMKTISGTSALAQLEELRTELRLERERAMERGTIDRDWFQRIVRSVIEWVPDDELTLVAALGGIVRAASALS